MLNIDDYKYLKNRYYNLRSSIYKTIENLNNASYDMSNTLDIGNYFQINGHSAENGKFKNTKEDIDYLISYLQNKVIPYLNEQINIANEKIQELLLMESTNG